MVFLTPEGTDPEHDLYVAYDYLGIIETLESIIINKTEAIPPETAIITNHYISMVRRHIVTDARLESLAVKLYERHKEAFDFIYKCRPETKTLLTALQERISSTPGLIVDSEGRNVLRFCPTRWNDEFKSIKADTDKWTKTGRMLLFEIKTYPKTPGRVNLSLIIGPGQKSIRESVYYLSKSYETLFKAQKSNPNDHWATIYSRDLINAKQGSNLSFDEQTKNLGLSWSDFQSKCLPEIIDAMIAIDNKII